MSKKTSLWLIAALMSSVPYAYAGRPSAPAQQQPVPSNTPDANPSSPTPGTTPPSSNTPNPADQNNAAQQPGFLSTTAGQATTAVGALGAAGVVALGIGYGVKRLRNPSNAQSQFPHTLIYNQEEENMTEDETPLQKKTHSPKTPPSSKTPRPEKDYSIVHGHQPPSIIVLSSHKLEKTQDEPGTPGLGFDSVPVLAMEGSESAHSTHPTHKPLHGGGSSKAAHESK